MDIHTVESDTFSVEDVVKAHMEDLAVQEKFGVIQKKYWVNVDAKTLFCLMEGPSKEACNQVHIESHGNTACNIIEVLDDEFNLFLGEGTAVNDLAYTNSGQLDNGYRTIMLMRINEFSYNDNYSNEIYRLIEKFKGSTITQPDEDLMASFILATDAILCSKAISKLLQSKSESLEYTLTLISGRPVDENGNDLFDLTKKKLKYLCLFGIKNNCYIDSETILISNKEIHSTKPGLDEFIVFKEGNFKFLFQVFDVLDQELFNPDFSSEDFNELLGLSKSQTYRKIKSLSGLAPNQLIQEIRLRKSLYLLKQNNKTISEIAFDLGFNSPTYFARLFKKRFSITPTHFIKISSQI